MLTAKLLEEASALQRVLWHKRRAFRIAVVWPLAISLRRENVASATRARWREMHAIRTSGEMAIVITVGHYRPSAHCSCSEASAISINQSAYVAEMAWHLHRRCERRVKGFMPR